MKKNAFLLSINLLVVAGLSIFLFACDPDPKPSQEEVFEKKLSATTWTLATGSVEGRDVTTAFANLSVTFDAKSFTVTNAVPPIWPSSGTFNLQSRADGSFDLLRSDDVLLEIITLTDNQLKIKLQYSSSSGRVNSVSGQYEFEFKKP